MLRWNNINKVPLAAGPGVMSGREAASFTRRGGPALCEDCFQRPARTQTLVKGKAVKVCFDCVGAPAGKGKKSGRRKGKKAA